jgi:D-amino-acid oxidase
VTIVGAGVIGMTTGITLLENGYMVEIIANATTPDTTSDKAAAFWLPFLSDANDDFIKWSNGIALLKLL